MKKNISLAILLVTLLMICGNACASDVVIVVNKSVKVSEISADELRDVFSGQKSSLKDGTRVAPVTLKEGASHDAFLKEYVGKTDSAFRATWRNLVFSGQAAMPKTLESENAMVEYVANTAGAIGYVSKAAHHDNVKTLSVK